MNDLLSQVKIASPCRARWEDMTGDDRSRFCGRCEKHVYNFSAMTAAQVEDLIRAKEGKLCGRYFRRKDGTMLTANCPVGKRAYFMRLRVLAAAGGTILLSSFAVMASNRGNGNGEKGPLAQKCDEWLWTVKGWLGLQPPLQALGEITVALPPPPPTPSNTSNGSSSSGNEGEKAAQP